MRAIRIGVAAALAGSLLALTSSAFAADQVKYRADLKPSSEIPAIVDSKGSGTLEATYDPITKKLTYILAWRDLTGPATAAHFHGPADAKTNAGPAVPINVTIGNPVKGAADLTDAQAADLAAGKWYVNVHTEAHKGGEIRGQVMKTN
ncbi:MAG: CHRD domain-containing protein [Alphaproteobacteria bacterium]|nr:CHRD domain-containing protein [Alphaproteobacteria bacterium]MBV8412567.1 CHRD domain-containing protein [Alphaproteobacteria bacterium]